MTTPEESLEYAKRLAMSLWRNHYTGETSTFVPFDDMGGVLTQIDNMVSGMMRRPPAMEWTQELPTERGIYWMFRPGHLNAGPFQIEVAPYVYLGGDLGVMLGMCSYPERLTDKLIKGSWWMGPIIVPSTPEPPRL